MIAINSELLKIHDIIKDINVSCFSVLASDTKASLSSLSSNLNSILDRFGIGEIWSDEVSREINGETRRGLSTMIEGCSSPACELLETIGVSVGSLISTLSMYLEKFEEYKRLNDERRELASHEPSEYVYDNRTKKYKDNPYWGQWHSQMNSYNNLIKQLETVILQLEEQGKSQVNNLRSLLSPIGTSASNAAINTDFSSSVREEKITLDNGNSKVVVSILEDGKTVLDNYTIYDSNGLKIGYGTINYDSAGNKTIEEYLMYQDDGSIKYGTKDYTNPVNIKDNYFISNSDGSSSSSENIYDSSGNRVETSEKIIGKDGLLESEKTVIYDGDINRIEDMNYNGDGVGSRSVTITDDNGNIIHKQDVGLVGIPDDTPITIDGNNVTLNFNPNTYEGYDNIDEVLTKLGVTSQGDKNRFINMLTGGERELEINGKNYVFNLDGNPVSNDEVYGPPASGFGGGQSSADDVSGSLAGAMGESSVKLSSASSDVGSHAGARKGSYSTFADAITDYEGQGLSHEDAALQAESDYARGDFVIDNSSNNAGLNSESGIATKSSGAMGESSVKLSSASSDVGSHAGARKGSYSTFADAITDYEGQGLSHEDAALQAESDYARGDFVIDNSSNNTSSNSESGIVTKSSGNSDYVSSFKSYNVGDSVLYDGEEYSVVNADVDPSDNSGFTGYVNLAKRGDDGSIGKTEVSIQNPSEVRHFNGLYNESVPVTGLSDTSGLDSVNSKSNTTSYDVPSFNNYKVGDSVWYEGDKYAVTSLNVDPSDPYGINGSAGLAKINNDGTTSGKTEFVIGSPNDISPFDN